MTDPVNTNELRAITRDRNDVLSAWEVDAVNAAADEVDRLRAVIENAPHDIGCASPAESLLGAARYPNRPCTCWKAASL